MHRLPSASQTFSPRTSLDRAAKNNSAAAYTPQSQIHLHRKNTTSYPSSFAKAVPSTHPPEIYPPAQLAAIPLTAVHSRSCSSSPARSTVALLQSARCTPAFAAPLLQFPPLLRKA